MFRRMVIGALLLLAVVAAPASAAYDFNVSPGEVSPGGAVTVSGKGCQPGAEVTITLTQTSAAKAIGDTITVATGVTDENGEFTIEFQVPEGTAAGTYRVAALCDGTEVAAANITVMEPSTPSTTAVGTSTGPIVRTGSDLNGLGLAGAGLIAVGGIILLATRSRRHQAA